MSVFLKRSWSVYAKYLGQNVTICFESTKLTLTAPNKCNGILSNNGSNGLVKSDLSVCRCMSNGSGETIMNVFDRKTKRMQKNRTALQSDYAVYDYIKEEFGWRTFDRICDIKREFSTVVDLGCGRGYVSKHLQEDMVKHVYQCEFADKVLLQAESPENVQTTRLIVDEEFIPFKDKSIDLVVSSLSLHWVNDLPGCFRQVHRCLRNDGVFLGCMFGGDTLYQLRVSLQLAETEKEGGFAPHVSPFTDVRDLGDLLNRAGYTMLTIDFDEMTVNYPSMFELMADLKGMGENNCAWSRKLLLRRSTAKAAAAIYKDMYGNEEGVPATFQVINFIAWKPDPSQPKAAERGSQDVSLRELNRMEELVKEINTLRDDQKDKK